MTTFVLISLITIAAASALLALGDSAMRGMRSYKRLSAQRKLDQSQRLASVTIIGDMPVGRTQQSKQKSILGQKIIRTPQSRQGAANSLQWHSAAAA